MSDPRVAKIADVLIHYSLGVRPGQKVLLRGTPQAAPLIREAYRAALKAGGLVVTQVVLPGMEKIFFDEANDQQMDWVSPLFQMAVREFDAMLSIESAANTKEGTGFDLRKQARVGLAAKPLRDLLMDRASRGEFRWCVTLFPSFAHAQDAEMSLEDYEDFVFGACLPDAQNPIGFWEGMEARQARLIRFLDGIQRIRLVAPDTDLTVGVGGRKWINCAGRENFPDGEVFTGPVETETEGEIRFTYPAVHQGTEVTDVRLEFKAGRAVAASAGKGEGFLTDTLDRDPGARVLGEFAIGTNPGIARFTRNTLFDEKIMGTVHMALGTSYPESGGQNESQVHWDMVCDLRQGGRLYADGRLIYENGDFVPDLAQAGVPSAGAQTTPGERGI